MRLISAGILLLATAYFSSCNDPFIDPCRSGNDNLKDTIIDLSLIPDQTTEPHFFKIYPQFSSELSIAENPSINLNGESSILGRFSYEQSSDTVSIDYSKCIRGNAPISAKFNIQEPKGFMLYGSSSISIKALNLNNFHIETHHEASAKVSISLDKSFVNQYGMGNVEISDSISEARWYLHSDGKIDGINASVKQGYVSNYGKGDIHIGVYGDLFVEIADSGNVYYKGNPTITKVGAGYGQVIQVP